VRTVSTWSLHRTLGRFVAPESAALGGPFMPPPAEPGGLALLDLPGELARRGYDAVQICHFHLPSTAPAYLAQLREALATSGIALETLLIDDGELSDLAHAARIDAWIDGWLEVAVALGATRARVTTGRAAPTPELVRAVGRRLAGLAAAHPGVRIVIENWQAMLPDAETVLALLAETGDAVGLLIDLGNWKAPGKYAELARIAPRAETCHAKCHVVDGALDAADFRRALQVLKDAGYRGPLALIYDGPDPDEWAWLDAEQAIVQEFFA
jgi:sugar phosphate isomerase/epimerase